MRNFRELTVWQKGFDVTKKIYELVVSLPAEEKYGLRSQLTRAAISIPSNIAEGASRSSDQEFRHFLEISLGSCFEIETQLLLVVEQNWLEKEKIEIIITDLNELQKMLGSFIYKLKSRGPRPNTQDPRPSKES